MIGKTEALLNIIGRFAFLDLCTIMIIDPTLEMVQDFSKTRLTPMIKDTEELSQLFFDVSTKEKGRKEAKTRDSNNTILSKIFPGGRLIMCGANSPVGLASRPVRILLADEVDRFPDSAGVQPGGGHHERPALLQAWDEYKQRRTWFARDFCQPVYELNNCAINVSSMAGT